MSNWSSALWLSHHKGMGRVAREYDSWVRHVICAIVV